MNKNEAKKAPKMHVKKDDMVVVISGKDKSPKPHKVVGAFPAEGKVLVEGINMITRHVKPRKTGQQGGRIKQEGAIAASKVMLWCPKCERPVRAKHVDLPDGGKGRVCGRCQETLE